MSETFLFTKVDSEKYIMRTDFFHDSRYAQADGMCYCKISKNALIYYLISAYGHTACPTTADPLTIHPANHRDLADTTKKIYRPLVDSWLLQPHGVGMYAFISRLWVRIIKISKRSGYAHTNNYAQPAIR